MYVKKVLHTCMRRKCCIHVCGESAAYMYVKLHTCKCCIHSHSSAAARKTICTGMPVNCDAHMCAARAGEAFSQRSTNTKFVNVIAHGVHVCAEGPGYMFTAPQQPARPVPRRTSASRGLAVAGRVFIPACVCVYVCMYVCRNMHIQ